MTPCRWLLISGAVLLGGVPFSHAQSDLAQWSAQRQGRYVYAPFTAMSSPVVLPMDGSVSDADWFTGLDASLGGIFFPHLHLDTATGAATTEQANLQAGHHDPNTNGFTWQNIEFGLSGRYNEHLESFATYAATVDAAGNWSGAYEEWFGKLQNLDAGMLGKFEVRGGRIYNRFGIQNTYHPHGFDWADQYLVNARVLGDDSMTIIGGDVSWLFPVSWTSLLDVAVGVAPAGEEHDEHGADEAGDAVFAAADAAFDSVMTVANWTNIYHYNDFHQYRAGLSGAWGDNASGRGTGIYGAHLEYQWRQNGFESGGRYLRWRSESMWRRWEAGAVEHHPESADLATLRDFGFYSSLLYGFHSRLESGLRAEYVTGDGRAGLDERFRLSPGLTYYINDARTLKFRVQYNFDHSSDLGTNHGVWGQVSFNWGGPEVR